MSFFSLLSSSSFFQPSLQNRSRGLAIWEKGSASSSSLSSSNSSFLPPVEPSASFWEFAQPGRDEAEATVRVHVMGSDSPLDRFLRGLPPLPPPPPRKEKEKRGATKEEEKAARPGPLQLHRRSALAAPPPPPYLPSSPSSDPALRFIPDRVFEVRLASSGPLPGWGGGAWCLLRVSSSRGGGGVGGGEGSKGGSGDGGSSGGGLSLDSDECLPRRVVAAPWSRIEGDPRPLRTSRVLAQGAGVAVTARWSSGEEDEGGSGGGGGRTTTLSLGGEGEEEEEAQEERKAKKLPPLQTLRLAGMTADEAADLCLEIRSRVAAAAAAAAAVKKRGGEQVRK